MSRFNFAICTSAFYNCRGNRIARRKSVSVINGRTISTFSAVIAPAAGRDMGQKCSKCPQCGFRQAILLRDPAAITATQPS